MKGFQNQYNKTGQRSEIEMEKTLSIIKPDAVKKNIIGSIQKRFEDAEMLLKSQKLQLILMSMVGGISILCLLLILRKFSKKQ